MSPDPERDDEFRDEFRAWLAEHEPPVGIEFATTPEQAEALREWHRTLHAGRWVGIHWPEEYGGRGASVLQVAIYNQELARVESEARSLPASGSLKSWHHTSSPDSIRGIHRRRCSSVP